MLLKFYLRLCFVSMDNFIHAYALNELQNHYLPLRPLPWAQCLWTSAFGYLLHTSSPLYVNWTHCLSLFLHPTPHFPRPLSFCVPYLGKYCHTHLSQTETSSALTPSFHSSLTCPRVLSPTISSFCPFICSTATILVQATYIFHLDDCSTSQLLSSLSLLTHYILHATTRVIFLQPQCSCFSPFSSLLCNPISFTGSSCVI